jgi:DNA invertase Pin-like site-specific DNA recombinase
LRQSGGDPARSSFAAEVEGVGGQPKVKLTREVIGLSEGAHPKGMSTFETDEHVQDMEARRQRFVCIPRRGDHQMPAHYGKFVAYYRVSTDKQGKSGLGLDAQKEAVQQRLNGGRWQIVGEFIEVESGKRAKRPQLEAALAACKRHKAKLIVAKLDRLSRNVGFIHKLIGSGVEVLFADLPELNGAMGKFMLITMANVAELEAGLISERTKAALKAAKARGVKLGRHGAEILAPQYRKEARQRAMQLAPVIKELRGKGYSMARIATELNKRRVATPRGGWWDHSSVRNVLNRLAA